MITMEVDYEENSLEDKNPTFGDIEEIEDIVDKKFRNFKNFTVLQSLPNDHRFLSRRSFNRIDPEKIKLEWDGMKKNLPSSIYVRTYKSRIDLMRAAITGIEGTPFCHGLFFFDIYIPHNYPTSPPEISYRGILGFNPDGKISLRSWIPGNFGLLQVLVSIQDRILNDRPCYLLSDSQYLKSKNEVFLLSCEAMIWTLRCPLMDFQDFISGYFRKRAHTILLIYKNQIGKDKLFFNLVRAFEANGAYCQHHYTKEELKEKDEEMGEEKDQSTLKIANKIIKSLACLLDQ